MTRPLYIAGWGYALIAAAMFYRSTHPERYQPEPAQTTVTYGGSDGASWFQAMKPKCNTLEVQLAIAGSPPPAGWEGAGYGAACLALAGKIDRATELIDALPEDDRVRAAGVVFDVGHPVADAGDDLSAGPMMEIVVQYWPNHYMALYHAGMAEYRTGRKAQAKANLEAFLREYAQEDGWRSSAQQALKEMAAGSKPERELESVR